MQAIKLAIKLFSVFGDFAGREDGSLVEVGDGVLGVVAFVDFADPVVVVAVDRLADKAHAHIVALDDAVDLGDACHHVVGGQDDAEIAADRPAGFEPPPAVAGAPDFLEVAFHLGIPSHQMPSAALWQVLDPAKFPAGTKFHRHNFSHTLYLTALRTCHLE